MWIAVEGCCHGQLDDVYRTVAEAEKHVGRKVELLLICGDFQATRNEDDLLTMCCPPKYRHMHDFYRYYSGEARAPVPTVVIGGNHEASNHLQELPYGGFLAPNIYYLGYAGVVSFGGVRIAGASGIFKQWDYLRAHDEAPPYSASAMHSVYHVRECDVLSLSRLTPGRVDVLMSHDWPAGITAFGDVAALLRRKPFFREDIERGKLGCPPFMQLLRDVRPRFWFAAHLHVKFAAVVAHDADGGADGGAGESRGGGGGGDAGKKEEEEEEEEAPDDAFAHATRFLALGRVMPRQDFLQLLEVEGKNGGGAAAGAAASELPFLELDAEWLAILRHQRQVTPEEVDEVVRLLGGELRLSDSGFRRRVAAFDPQHPRQGVMPESLYIQEHTARLVKLLSLSPVGGGRAGPHSMSPSRAMSPTPAESARAADAHDDAANPEEIDLDVDL